MTTFGRPQVRWPTGGCESYNSRLVEDRLVQIRYTLSERDLWESQRAQRGWKARTPPLFGALLILSGIYTLVQDPSQFGLAIGAILVGVFVGFGSRMAVWYAYRRDKRLHDQFVATFSDAEIEVTSSVASSKFEWRAFTQQLETKRLFLLFQGPGCVNIFPKNCFGADEADGFRKLIKEKIGEGAGMDRKGFRPTTWIFIAVVSVALVLLLITIRNTLRQPPAQPAQTQSTN